MALPPLPAYANGRSVPHVFTSQSAKASIDIVAVCRVWPLAKVVTAHTLRSLLMLFVAGQSIIGLLTAN